MQGDDIVIEPLADDGASEGTPEQKLKKLRDALQKAQHEAAENLAGWQRSKADYINLERRMRESSAQFLRAGTTAVLGDLTQLGDSLEAAEKSGGSVEGIRAVKKQFESILERHEITRFTPTAGEIFDPLRHEAVSTVATKNESEDNTIHTVMQSGFALQDTVVRPARVVVYHFES